MTRYLVLAALVVALAGCADDAAPLSEAAFSAQCRGDGDCPADTRCHSGFQICVAREHNPTTVALAVSPPPDSALADAHLAGLTFAQDNTLDIGLPAAVEISGRVEVQQNDAQTNGLDGALIRAVAQEQVIGGKRMRAQATTTAGVYTLRLVAGVAYDVTVSFPDDATRPDHHFVAVYDAAASGQNILLPPVTALPHLKGHVFRVLGTTKMPLEGVSVTAVRSDDTSIQCTSATTDIYGAYVLTCADAGPYELRVGPGTTAGAIPAFTPVFAGQKAVAAAPLPTGKADADDAPPEDNVPPIVIGEKSRDTDVTLQVVDPNGVGVPGVEVRVSGELEDTLYWTSARVWRQVTTDVNGSASLKVFRGTYRIAFAPGTASPLGSTVLDAWDVGAQSTISVQLEPKVNLVGRVTTHAGGPVAAVDVYARTEFVDPYSGLIASGEYTTRTDADGSYTLPVDAGTFVVSVEPTEDRALPRVAIEGVVVAQTSVQQDLELPLPSLIQGRVLGPDGEPAGNVSIDVYSISEHARILGRARSDAQGSYHVILPCPKP